MTDEAVEQRLKDQHWEAIATGFALPLQSVQLVVWVSFWRRAAVRAGRVGSHVFDEHGHVRDGYQVHQGPAPNWPWVIKPPSQLICMLRAAARWRAGGITGSWRKALSACESVLDEEIRAWLAPMSAANRAVIEPMLGSWHDAPDAQELLDHLEVEREAEGVTALGRYTVRIADADAVLIL